MGINIGSDTASLYVGSDAVSKVYLGSNEVWTPTPALPPAIASTVGAWWADDLSAVGDGNAITSWVDRVNSLSAVSSGSPVYDVDGLGSMAAVNFDGVNDCFRVASNISTSTTGCVVVVSQVTTPASDLCFWSAADESDVDRYLQANHWSSKPGIGRDNDGLLAGIRATGATTTSPQVTEWSSSDTAWTIRINNTVQFVTVEIGSNNGSWFGDVTGIDNFMIGALRRTTEAKYFLGKIAYIGVFDAELSSEDRTALYNWISSYYGIAVA